MMTQAGAPLKIVTFEQWIAGKLGEYSRNPV
jgi:hypothetical protein